MISDVDTLRERCQALSEQGEGDAESSGPVVDNVDDQLVDSAHVFVISMVFYRYTGSSQRALTSFPF